MSVKIITFLPLLAAFALGGCESVACKQPVGDKVAVLTPEIWNAKWQDGYGETVKTSIKDARLGIVDIKVLRAGSQQGINAPSPDMHQILVRTLGTETIINCEFGPPGKVYLFWRADVDDTHLVFFWPNAPTFVALIKRHKIAGTLERDKNGKPTGSCTLEHFSTQDVKQLQKAGIDPQSLFQANPGNVFIRAKWHPFWYFF